VFIRQYREHPVGGTRVGKDVLGHGSIRESAGRTVRRRSPPEPTSSSLKPSVRWAENEERRPVIPSSFSKLRHFQTLFLPPWDETRFGRRIEKQTQTDPLSLSQLFSVDCAKNGKNKPIANICNDFCDLTRFLRPILQFLNGDRFPSMN